MKYLILSVFFLSATCNSDTTQLSDTKEINQCWRYSYEDNTDDYVAYRPCDYDFPPSRGREGMTFSADGKFTYRAIGAADGVDALPGTWEIKDGILTMNFAENARETKRYKVVAMDAEMMKLKQLN